MPVDRLLPDQDAADLIALTRDIADKVLTPIVDEHERSETYPEGVFAQLGAAGLLSLAQPEEWGGAGQPFEVYLQVLEVLAARWAAVAVAVSVHSLSCNPLLSFGTEEQKQRWLWAESRGRGDPRWAMVPVGVKPSGELQHVILRAKDFGGFGFHSVVIGTSSYRMS